MERSEPTFVPEWYKGTSNSATGSSNSNHSIGSLHSASEEHSNVSLRNRLPASVCDHDTTRFLSFSDRTSSSLRRSLSSNGSMGREKDNPSRFYSSLGRSNRDWDREKDLDLRDRARPVLPDNGFLSCPDSLVTNLYEKDSLKHSHPLVSGRRSDSWTRKLGNDSSNGAISGGSMGVMKSTFERNFPSLGTEDKHMGSDVAGFSSPSLSTTFHNISLSGASAIYKGDGWTSALVEAPSLSLGNGHVSSCLQTCSVMTTSSSSSSGLNMAETLAQAPGRVYKTPQLPSDSQKIEDIHRQKILKLRPVTPLILKNLGPNSADRSKTKVARTVEFSVSKQQPLLSQLVINGTDRSDVFKTSSYPGQFQVLNRERISFTPTSKDSPNSTRASRVPISYCSNPSATILPSRDSVNSNHKADGMVATLTTRSSGEKKVAFQTQNRNDFFNSLRKKTSVTRSANANDDQDCDASSSSLESLGYQASANSTSTDNTTSMNSALPCFVKDGNCAAGGCGTFEEPEKLAPNEEEAAFLRSLGWEENAGEEALTREEIENFLSEYKDRKPASKLK